jgi:hypothetical protein
MFKTSDTKIFYLVPSEDLMDSISYFKAALPPRILPLSKVTRPIDFRMPSLQMFIYMNNDPNARLHNKQLPSSI